MPVEIIHPHYNKQGQLTRAGMEAKIKSGGSVVYNGQIHSNVNTLPSEAALAAKTGDDSEVDRVRQENEATIKRLTEENASLKKKTQEPSESDDLESLSVSKLHSLAKAAGIKGQSTMGKVELVTALNDAAKDSPPAPPATVQGSGSPDPIVPAITL